MRGMRRLIRAKHYLQELAYGGLKLSEVEERVERDRLVQEMGFPGQWDEHRRFQIAFLKANGVTPSSRVLEIGYGPLTLGVPLIGFLDANRYVGVDIRQAVASIAYQQIARHNLTPKNPRIIVSDDFASDELKQETFDFIWSFSVLFHLTDEQAARHFEVAAQRLAPQGALWANINADEAESRWLEFPFVQRPPEFYEKLGREAGLKMKNLGPLEGLDFRLDALEKRNFLLEFKRA